MKEPDPSVPVAGEAATTSDERTMAVLANVLQLIGGWIAPLIIFFLKRESRFITFHALQVLLFQIACLLLEMFGVGGWFIAMALGLSFGVFPPQGSKAPPLIFVFFALVMLSFFVLWILKLLLAVIYGIKAGRGEWAEYPLFGKLARHILNIRPRGAALHS